MNPTPDIQPLPYKHRKYFFRFLLTFFLIALPVAMFYTNGYRFDFSDDTTQIVSTGGLFVNVSDLDAEVYIDEELERDIRIVRSATYVQNLDAGVHQIHVQQAGSQTWVKRLPVYPHLVTEAAALSLPEVPQVRLISEFETRGDEAVVFVAASTTPVLTHASTTNIFIATTSRATTTYQTNTEFAFVRELFASSTATTTESLIDIVTQGIDDAFAFNAATSTATSSAALATTTKAWRDVELYEQGDEVYARYVGDTEDTPYYYCVNYLNATTTAQDYGTHVAEVAAELLASSTDQVFEERQKVCRDSVRIDRKWQEVVWFDFFPDSTDLVLMHLTDGLYVVEIDDRGWQNTQLLYPGENLVVTLDGGRIFVKDQELLLEVFTEIQ